MCYKYLYSYYIIFVYARKEVTLQRFIKEKPPNRTMKIINLKTQYLMKHFTQATANGLCTPPCGSSQSKSTRFSLLTSFLLFFLLLVGSNAAWARPTIYGEGLPGLNASGAANWDSNTKEMSAYGEANTYYAEFLNVAATDNNTYRFKIAVNDAGDWWSGAMDSNNTNESMGNVDIVSANETQISFKMPFDGDVYIFYKSSNANDSKVWIVAVPQVSAIGNTTAQSKTMKFDLLIKDGAWNTTINFIKNNVDALTYKYVTSYIAPACTSAELASSKAPRVRYEAYTGSGSDKFNGKGNDFNAELTTSVRRVIYLWNGSKDSAPVKYLIPTYPNRSSESGWKLWANDGTNDISGDLSNGSVTVQIEGGKSVKYFITNSSSVTGPNTSNFTDNTRHSVNSFGGCYVDEENSSNVSFGTKYQIYNSNDGGVYKLGNIAKYIESENKMRGLVTIDGSGTKDVTFSFDGGKITINAVDHGSDPEPPTPSGVTYDGSEYIFWNTNTGNNWGVLVYNYDRTQYLQFKNTTTNALSCTVKPAFLDNKHDGDGQEGILAAIAPAGTWHQVRACRIDANNWNGQNTSGSPISDGVGNWVDLEEGKNYLYKDNGNLTWGTHSLTNFRFYLSGTTNLTGQDWGWKGNNTEYAGTAVKTLNADTYQFKLNPVGAYIYQSSGRNQWLCEANYNDFDQENSNVTCSNVDNDRIQFTLSRKHDVTIAWSGYKITVNAVPYYNVTFNSDGGSDVASQSVLSGGTASQPSDPTKAGGYTFNGWKLNDAAYNFSTAVTSDIELVADWTAPTLHTVRFMDGETELTELAQNIAEGTYASEPDPAPTKSGYSSVKWQLNGVDYNFSTSVTTDITLDAVWTAKTLESISLDESSIVMVMGGSNATLTPSYLPTDLIAEQQPTYDWSVSPSGVVTVDGGVITAVGEGTATVTCTAHGTDKSADCVVTVKDCNTEPTDIFSYTLGSDPTGDAAGSAVMNGMFDEADNTEPANLTMVTLALRYNQGDKCWVYDVPESDVGTQIRYTKQNSTPSADQYYWYRKEIGKTGSNLPIYVFKNVLTGHYLAKAEGGGDNNWSWVQAISASTYEDNTAQWHEATSNGNRLMNLDRSDGDATYTKKDYFLHCKNIDNSNTDGTHIVVGSSDGDQGDDELKFGYPTSSEVANPAYMHSPVSGYYRFAIGASVVATLNRAIKVNDVIRLEVKNPSEAAVSASVTIGSQVENINLAAGTTTTEEITVTDANRPTSITIASNDVDFMLKSVVVNREMPNPGKDPNLAWGATPSAAHQVAAGDISDYIATRSGAGIITYTSSDESIATVAADGTVHPIAEGTVTITATLEQDGCYNGGTINYSLTLEDLPKPTITLTVPDAAVPQGSVQTISASQNGNGEFTVSILSGSDATLTNNGDGTYTLRLGDNASNIVIEAATTRTLTYAQHAVTETVEVTNCAPDGRIIYSYALTGHDDLNAAETEGGTYSQANLASVGTDDNPKTVTIVKLKFRDENDGRIFAVDNAGTVNVQSDGSPNKAQWLLIPAGENIHPSWANSNCAVYYLRNKATERYLYRSTDATTGDWGRATIGTSENNTGTDYYKWFFEYSNNKYHIFAKEGIANDLAHSFRLNSSNQYNNCYENPQDKTKLYCGSMTDDNAYSGIYTDNGEMNVGSANNPDYFYSVENDNHTYYILNGGTVTVSRASAFKAGDVITLNVFNRGAAAGNTIKVAENTIATNVNGAAALQYTVAEGDGIQGQNNFVITPLNGYICLSSISIFRPKDEDEFINPTLTWDADLSAQQVIDINNNETGMTHTVSVNAPVNEAVVYSVSPAAKADINSATGALTLTNEALNKDVLTVTATLPAIGCYNQAVASYEIYVKNLAAPSLSATFGTLQQGYASTLTVTTNSDAVPALSSISGFALNGDPTVDNGAYTYNIIVSSTAEAVSVHVALAETADYLAYAIDAADANVAVSNIADLYDNTPANGTLVLEADYAGELIVDKAITINGNGHSIGNLTVQTEGDLTLSGNLTVNDFSICAKAGNTTTPAASGQVRNATNLTANGNAYFYYTVDPSGHVQYGWYDFTVPFRVNVMTGIKGIQNEVLNEDFVNERDYAVMEHLGEKQAAGEYAYKKFRGVMEPCRLYSITLDPQNNYNTIRFQKADGDLVAGNEVTLNTYASTVDDKHANWNGVGNGTLHHADAGVSAEYIQVYQSGDKTFLAVDKTEYSLVIGSAFMVQETGTMTLSQATHSPLLAPKRAASVQPTAIQIASEGQPFSDQLFISADETAGQVYTQGADVAKAGNIGNVNVPQIWTNAYNSKLCAHEAQLINGEASYTLSLYAPANGSYTLTSKNIPEGYTLYLTQNGNRIWDLSESYVLDLTKGTATEYGLLLVENYKMPTAVENIGSQADETQKIMRNGILYILRNGKVFNAQGAVMK